MKTLLRLRCLDVALTAAAIFMVAAPAAWAGKDDDSDSDEEIPFDEAEVFFELNDTDGDLGIHSLIDGGPWKKLEMEDPRGRRMLRVNASGRLRRQGLTELFFESAEPVFADLPPDEFFARFPEGDYEIEGVTLDGEELESETELTHLMPAPPDARVNMAPLALVCDDENEDYDAPEVMPPITIAWPAVEFSHPTLGTPLSSEDIEIHNYEVVVEADLEISEDEELTVVFSTILPPGITSLSVPAEFIALTDVWKYEVLVREESFNQTAVESCFEIAEE